MLFLFAVLESAKVRKVERVQITHTHTHTTIPNMKEREDSFSLNLWPIKKLCPSDQ